jgi:drug/metabolite transporter (DMT)-like permease
MVVEPLVVGLLLMAALMHASWNAILKSDQSDRLATFGVIMTTGTLMGLCAVPFLPLIEPAAWKYLAASVTIHVLYYTFLLKAYSYGDLSHTYPIARGLGPLLVLAIVLRPATVWAHLRRTWWRGAIGGVIANVGYGIAIYALVLGPMAHIAALRETSVLFGALMGTLLLGEPFGLRRVAAAFVIVVGLVMMNGPQLI